MKQYSFLKEDVEKIYPIGFKNKDLSVVDLAQNNIINNNANELSKIRSDFDISKKINNYHFRDMNDRLKAVDDKFGDYITRDDLNSHIRSRLEKDDDLNNRLRSMDSKIEDAKNSAAWAQSNAAWEREEAARRYWRQRREEQAKTKSATTVAGGLIGGYLGKKIGDKIGKVDRIKEFKDMVLRSNTIIDLEQKVKKSGFDKVYPTALKYIEKNRGNPKWKTHLSNVLTLKRVLFPSIGGVAGTALGGVAGYYGGDYLNHHPETFDF